MSEGRRRSNGARRLCALLVTFALIFGSVGHAAPKPGVKDRPGPNQSFPVTREGERDLPGHTVFHPTDLDDVGFKMPIVVWGNGGCRNSNEEYRYFLMNFASYGYFIVANGPPENPYRPEELDGLVNPQPQKLIDAIDWALEANGDPASEYFDRLDPGRVVAMGQSCGGGEAITASADPRVATTIAWNEGVGDVTGLHAPILHVSGGISDFVLPNVLANYHLSQVPTVHADHASAGHTGMWDDPSDGSAPPGPYQDIPLLIAPKWIDFVLYGDRRAERFFLGDGCGLCEKDEWTVQSKNWES
jgi:hypothetical protein